MRGEWMNRWACILLGLAVLAVAVGAQAIEVARVGEYRVSKFAAAHADVQGDPIATGELIIGPESDVRFSIAGDAGQMRLSLAQARSVHQLLGHMLTAATQAPPVQTQPSQAKPKQTTTTQPLEDARRRPFLGINLADVTYYTRAWVFTDLMLQSDAWRSDGSGHIFMNGKAPPGRYICTWSGSGSIRFSGAARATKTGPGSAEVVVAESDKGISMQKTGEVTTVSLIRADQQTRASPYQSEFLRRLRPFKVIRFMDWANTNNSGQVEWVDRTQPDARPQAGRNGVAIEGMISLCNELGADPWFCMPHAASDDYIRRYARLVKAKLRPGATIYVEWSNEVWNSQFKQHNWVRRRGDGRSLSDAFYDAWAQRCREVFDIWTQELGEDGSHRLVRVAAVHLQNPGVARELLPRLAGRFDAVAPSAYFGITRRQAKTLHAGTSADDILNLCDKNLRERNTNWYKQHGRIAGDWSRELGRPIRLISYEAGQHLSANGADPPYARALIQAQSHPRMYGLYLMNMRLFEQAGGDLFTAFNDVGKTGKFGSWGHLQYQTQPTDDAPKYRALLEYPLLKDQQ